MTDRAYEGNETRRLVRNLGFEAGWQAGYLAYSPDMETEVDQFAAYALKPIVA